MAHIQLTAYYGARSFAASRASPCSQSAPSLHSFKGFFTNCSSFHRNSSRKWFTLCMLFILNKRCLRDTKTYSCKCSKSKNFEQVSFPMKESLLDTASCQTRRDNARPPELREKLVVFIQLYKENITYSCTLPCIWGVQLWPDLASRDKPVQLVGAA